jgi:putative hydrolase of the HAD superfamily
MAVPLITTLFLDIGGVILTNGWDKVGRRKASQTFNLDYEEINERHHLTFDTYELGKLSLNDYLERVIFYQKRSFTRAAFKKFMLKQSQPVPEMIELIRELKAQYHLKLVAVSNEGRELNAYRIRNFELNSFIDFFVSSCYIHFRKPDADMYQLALDIAQVPENQVLYIDDRALFVDVARELGIQGICHTGYESTRTALASLGLAREAA